jgi:hypothetical protein
VDRYPRAAPTAAGLISVSSVSERGSAVDPHETVAKILGEHFKPGRWFAHDLNTIAERIVDGLGLQQESDADSAGGATVRYVTDWSRDP